MRRGYARGEARNEAIRQELEPLGPGERPRVLVVATVLAVAIAAANLILYFAGYEVQQDEQPSLVTTLLFAGIMLFAAWGLWTKRYWAVLGLQALLAVSVIYACLGLVQAGNLAAVAVTLAVIATSSTLFWFLVRAMARIQMPQRPARGEPS